MEIEPGLAVDTLTTPLTFNTGQWTCTGLISGNNAGGRTLHSARQELMDVLPLLPRNA